MPDPYALAEAVRGLVADPAALQDRIRTVVEAVTQETFTGTALSGGVVATVDGLGALRSIEIAPATKRRTDNLTLGDAVTAAVADAERTARTTLATRVAEVALADRLGGALTAEQLRRFIPE
ncbi:YbaB/EbfC family nucleoid-associated protein [Asanoa sp. NPDC050611]|uniref:YbaB/EbfC family nucleoid-associated protein n=1 Tax=Asanoa sp. NPDC050611 TaxID=3157098 RepID=UPI0033DD10A6